MYIKRKLLFLTMLCLSYTTSDAQNWEWAKSAPGGYMEDAYSLTVDRQANVYVTGAFTSTSLRFDTTLLINAGGYDLYLAKYDSSGNVLWAKSAGSDKNDWSFTVANDLTGNVYIAGRFMSHTLTFGSTILTNADTSTLSSDLFLTKYDAAGHVIWAFSAGGLGTEEAYSVKTTNSGEVILAGWFSSSTLTLGSYTLTNGGGNDIFIAKFDSLGHVLWARSASGIGNDIGNSVSVDSIGNIYIAGSFTSPVLTLGGLSLINSGTSDTDPFVAHIDANGNFIWARNGLGNLETNMCSVAADKFGNIYSTGNFMGTSIVFGIDTLINSDTSGFTADIFLTKYDTLGNVLWARRAGGTKSETSNSVSIDGSGKVLITGFYQSRPAVFGSISVTDPYTTAQLYVAGIDSTGNALWVKTAVGVSNSEGFSVCPDMAGNVYVAGYFINTQLCFGLDTVTNTGIDNMFIAKIALGGSSSLYIPSVSEKGNLIIYPNPVNDELKIENASKEATMRLYNMMGQLVNMGAIFNGATIINTANLQQGDYLLQIIDYRGEITSKIIMKK